MWALGHSHHQMNCALHAESSHAGIGKQFLKNQTHALVKLKGEKNKNKKSSINQVLKKKGN